VSDNGSVDLATGERAETPPGGRPTGRRPVGLAPRRAQDSNFTWNDTVCAIGSLPALYLSAYVPVEKPFRLRLKM
jgi:hypothetical protein